MINNRNKSVVRGMKWTSDGQKICIVYEDGEAHKNCLYIYMCVYVYACLYVYALPLIIWRIAGFFFLNVINGMI